MKRMLGWMAVVVLGSAAAIPAQAGLLDKLVEKKKKAEMMIATTVAQAQAKVGEVEQKVAQAQQKAEVVAGQVSAIERRAAETAERAEAMVGQKTDGLLAGAKAELDNAVDTAARTVDQVIRSDGVRPDAPINPGPAEDPAQVRQRMIRELAQVFPELEAKAAEARNALLDQLRALRADYIARGAVREAGLLEEKIAEIVSLAPAVDAELAAIARLVDAGDLDGARKLIECRLTRNAAR